jgi:hypothetical protein
MASASGSPIGRTNQVHPELVTPGTPSSPGQNRLNRQPPPPDPWRKAIYQTFEDPSYNKTAKFISVGMMLIIIFSTLAFIFESELLIGGSLYDAREDAKTVFEMIEIVCVILFTIDYAVRILTCPKLCRFFWNYMNLIDLAAVLPFWAILFMKISNPGSSANGNFGFVRVIRLVRVFRVFKFGRYSIGLQMFAGALKGSVQPMGILIFVMSINMIILSSIVHIVELAIPDEDQSDMHKRCFGTISRTFWWAMVTMTTVGYGDCSPLSGLGKTIAVVAMLSGVLILALPITVIGSNFAKMVEMFEDDAAMYHNTDLDGDGLVDEMELREFLSKKRKEGVLRKDMDVKAPTLMEKFGQQGNGTLTMPEFLELQREVIDQTVSDPAQEVHDMQTKVMQQERHLQSMERMVNRRMAAIEDFLGKLGKHMEARGS